MTSENSFSRIPVVSLPPTERATTYRVIFLPTQSFGSKALLSSERLCQKLRVRLVQDHGLALIKDQAHLLNSAVGLPTSKHSRKSMSLTVTTSSAPGRRSCTCIDEVGVNNLFPRINHFLSPPHLNKHCRNQASRFLSGNCDKAL